MKTTNRNELLIERHVVSRFPFSARGTAQAVVDEALLYEAFPRPAQISLLLTDDEEIGQLNEEFRGIARPTDVLSFPAVPFQTAGDYSILMGTNADVLYGDPETGRMILGDIVINVPQCYRQASQYGHSVRREFAFLIAHSMLHLCGYDHMDPEEESIMIRKQEEILNRIGISR